VSKSRNLHARYGTHNQAPGTWSDDSSLNFCLAKSLTKRSAFNHLWNAFHPSDVMRRFALWLYEGKYTPLGAAFDVGTTTRSAIERFLDGFLPEYSGDADEKDNGNGALMHILPMALWLAALQGPMILKIPIVWKRCIGRRHLPTRTIIACGLYAAVAAELACDPGLGYVLRRRGDHRGTEITRREGRLSMPWRKRSRITPACAGNCKDGGKEKEAFEKLKKKLKVKHIQHHN
jgi:hypothetical protein